MLSNQWLNILIVGIYFVFLIVIGWIFRTFSSNTSDYFKGGGKMLWWMVGFHRIHDAIQRLVFFRCCRQGFQQWSFCNDDFSR